MRKPTVISKLTALLLLSVLASQPAAAQEIRPMLKVGLDFGGDKLATAVFTNGSTRTITANEGFSIGGGVSILNDTKDIETEIALSYKNASISASNGEINWTRFPVDALVFYRHADFRMGGGITYHLNPELSATGAAGNWTTKFQNALGFMLQADYGIQGKYFIGLRLTSLQYKLSNCAACTSAKGDGAGLIFSQRF